MASAIDSIKRFFDPKIKMVPNNKDRIVGGIPTRSFTDLAKIGDSGTVIFSGQISDIDYVDKLESEERFDIYDEMRFGDPTIGQGLKSLKLPILQAEDGFKAASEDAKDVEVKDFLEWCLKKNLKTPWQEVKEQAFLFKDFGVMLFEVVWGDVEYNGKKYLAPIDIAPRLSKTISEWWLKSPEPNEGRLGVRQLLQGGDGVEDINPFIPVSTKLSQGNELRKLLWITNRKEGDNFQGYSELRNIYGSWNFKKNLNVMDSIKHEKQSMGIIYAIVPPTFKSKAKLKEALRNVRNNSELHMLIEAQKDEVEIGFLDMKAGTTTKPMDSAITHNDDIGTGLGIRFLMNRETGSQARTQTELAFFLMQENYDRVKWESMIVDQLTPSVVDANFQVEDYPEYFVENIRFDDLNLMSNAVQKFTQSKVLDSDDMELTNLIRNKVGIPELSEEEFEEKKKEKAEKAKEQMEMMQQKGLNNVEKAVAQDKKQEEQQFDKSAQEEVKASEQICGDEKTQNEKDLREEEGKRLLEIDKIINNFNGEEDNKRGAKEA